MADVKKLAEELVSLTVKQVQELADVLKADYGIEPAAAAVARSGPTRRGAGSVRSQTGKMRRARPIRLRAIFSEKLRFRRRSATDRWIYGTLPTYDARNEKGSSESRAGFKSMLAFALHADPRHQTAPERARRPPRTR